MQKELERQELYSLPTYNGGFICEFNFVFSFQFLLKLVDIHIRVGYSTEASFLIAAKPEPITAVDE